jgi:hypothetical protein
VQSSRARIVTEPSKSAHLRIGLKLHHVSVVSQAKYQSEAYAEDYVFAYLQETFCAASDTFVCSGFTGM